MRGLETGHYIVLERVNRLTPDIFLGTLHDREGRIINTYERDESRGQWESVMDKTKADPVLNMLFEQAGAALVDDRARRAIGARWTEGEVELIDPPFLPH